MPLKSLLDISKSILKAHVLTIRDIGDVPWSALKDILVPPALTASQLHELEASSPHLIPETEDVWKMLCVNDFIEIRIAVEDGKMVEPESWRTQHEISLQRQEAKMQEAKDRLRRMRQEHDAGRATTKEVDGVQALKRRKLLANTGRPKSLMDKVRTNSRSISAIYAPRRKKSIPSASFSSRPAAPPTASTSARPIPASSSSSHKPSVYRPHPSAPAPSVSSPPSSASADSSSNATIPPPPTDSDSQVSSSSLTSTASSFKSPFSRPTSFQPKVITVTRTIKVPAAPPIPPTSPPPPPRTQRPMAPLPVRSASGTPDDMHNRLFMPKRARGKVR